MTAVSGGDEPDNDGRSPTGSVLERPAASAEGRRAAPRPLDQIFPLGSDTSRAGQMKETWAVFATERMAAVLAAVKPDRSPPEIAYAVGEIVHTYFRARGLTLTSYELRRLVAELLDVRDRPAPAPTPAPTPSKARVKKAASPPAAPRAFGEDTVVSFASEPAGAPWPGDDEKAPAPAVPDSVFEPLPSHLVSLLGREDAAFDRLLANVLELARADPMKTGPGGRRERGAAEHAIARAIERVAGDESEPLSAEIRQRLRLVVTTELCGLGLIDRLWADPTVHAVFVNGPGAVFVERGGLLEAVGESFRDEAHLSELLKHIVPRAGTGIAEFRLRDGSTGTIVFPPAAPRGPVVAIRRAEPGSATFERLIVADVLNRAMADLLRICARCRLNILVCGPPGSGKTALLAALARDMEERRVVTVTRRRVFRWSAPAKVELVAVPGVAPLPALLAAGAGLQPDLLVVDSVELEDVPALVERLVRGMRGTVAAVEPPSLATGLSRSVDLVLKLGRGRDGQYRVVAIQDAAGAALFVHEDGRFQRRATTPSFADTIRSLGLGEALASTLR
jgi:pilus assembly protein CpaF